MLRIESELSARITQSWPLATSAFPVDCCPPPWTFSSSTTRGSSSSAHGLDLQTLSLHLLCFLPEIAIPFSTANSFQSVLFLSVHPCNRRKIPLPSVRNPSASVRKHCILLLLVDPVSCHRQSSGR